MTHRGLGVASMGKASRTKVESTRREKIAAQRAAERRSEKRRRILLASGSVVAVLAIVLVFVVGVASGPVERPHRLGPGAGGGQGHLGARERPQYGRGRRRRGHREAHHD